MAVDNSVGWRGWLGGLALGALAVAVRIAAQPLIGDQLPVLFAFPATVLGAVLWGAGPGILIACACALSMAVPALPGQLPDATRRCGRCGSARS